MVNEFMSLSPRKQDDEDYYYRESSEKPLVSESSDEDTTSSSLMPIPDTLDVMRNELKNAINGFGTTDYVESPKPNDFTLKNLDLNTKQPTDREVSIARKITSANFLLDDLLNASNILPKDVKDKNPLVFNAKAVRQRSSPPESETSGPTSGSVTCSSEDRCPSVPMASFPYPQTVCDCSRHPTERPEPVAEPADNNPGVIIELKKSEKKSFLLEKIRFMRLRCKKRRQTLVHESQQTQPVYSSPVWFAQDKTPGTSCLCHQQQYSMGTSFRLSDHRGMKENCTCPAAMPPDCTCQTCECSTRRKTKDAKCGSDEGLECFKATDDSNETRDSTPSEQPTKVKIPLAPIPVRPKTGRERIDIYYFDHGNSSYYRTTDTHRARFTEYILERTDEYATKFWAEVFGTVTIVIAFVVSFVLQLYRCMFTAVIRTLTIGLIQIFSDYFFKPLLTVLFNGLIQPCLILGYNVATSTKDLCIPMCEICEFCAKDLAIIFGSCRLVEIKQRECSSPSCPCRHNV